MKFQFENKLNNKFIKTHWKQGLIHCNFSDNLSKSRNLSLKELSDRLYKI
ncbi:hypothetical protein CoNPh26_CDS0067 [Staphylococcus phage S-CoN_Ph26]|nr:hypothetical protein CoNPh26_CDS0067 [Staphylococcus phage S-CoN_Ph26]